MASAPTGVGATGVSGVTGPRPLAPWWYDDNELWGANFGVLR